MIALQEQLAAVREGTSTNISLPKQALRDGRIPDAVFDEPRVERLSAVGLRELPEAIGQLTALKTLILAKGTLTSLPRSLAKLDSLQQLEVTAHRLASLPDELASLPKLTVLRLFDNKLPNVDVAGSVAGLEELIVSHNPLIEIPATLCGHGRLQHLNASFSKLSRLPDGEGIPELRYARFASAGLTAFPALLLRCPRLIEVDVSKNAIRELPAELVSLSRLERLLIDSNPMPVVPPFLAELPRLWYVSAYGIKFPTALRKTVRANQRRLSPNAILD